MPKFEENAPADLVEAFGKTLTGMGGRLVTDSTNDTRAVADPQALADVDRTETDAATGEESEHAIPLRKGYTVFKVGLHFGPFKRLPLECSFLQRLVEAAMASFESCPVACKFAKRSNAFPKSPPSER